MYSQGLIGADSATQETQEFLDRFQTRIDAEEKIEPNDPMPEGFRRTLVRQIGQHAHSEIVGMLPEGNWITRAPTLRRKIALLAKVQDEGGHGLYLYSAAETLGVSREQMTEELALGQGQVFLDLQLPDADLGRHRRHRLAGRWRGDHEPDPALPLLLRPLCPRHDPRLQGRELPPAPGLRDHDDAGNGSEEQKQMAQDALNRWWWPSLMMFGPPTPTAPWRPVDEMEDQALLQ
jgi:ring-1,2-phenylacetyl-CoA epoxidase subunit PaaA